MECYIFKLMNDKKTKIVCTIGPATWDPNVMREIIESGMNCARVNGAFADPDELDKVRKLVKDVSDNVSLMVDVKGPEIRMNKFPEPIELEPGMEIVIGNTDADHIYPANYENVYTYVQPGQRIVIGDGDVEMVVDRIEGDKMIAKVSYGERLKPGKAMNLPGCDYSTEVLTLKDKENLRHAIETGWDFVSASFIQNAESARLIKEFIGDADMKLIAKIEDTEGVGNIDEILEIVDGVMVARGGLGVEMGLEVVPQAQRILIERCNEVGKPVITATQMLESMIDNPRPTRAEVSDVATAIILGSDAVMLSGESSAGNYPVEAVKMLTSIAENTEPVLLPEIIECRADSTLAADALTKAAAELCMNMEDEISAVVVVTKRGTTARLLGRHMITQPIYAFTSSDFYRRTLMLSKGIVNAYTFEGVDHTSPNYNRDFVVNLIIEKIKHEGVVEAGQKILFVAKTPIHEKGFVPNVFEIIEV